MKTTNNYSIEPYVRVLRSQFDPSDHARAHSELNKVIHKTEVLQRGGYHLVELTVEARLLRRPEE